MALMGHQNRTKRSTSRPHRKAGRATRLLSSLTFAFVGLFVSTHPAWAARSGRQARIPQQRASQTTSTVVVTLEPGEHFERSVQEHGLSKDETKQLARVLRRNGAQETLRSGATYELELDGRGRLASFTHHTAPGIIYHVARRGGQLRSETTRLEARHRVVRISGMIRGSLKDSLEELGGDPALAFMVSEIFSSDADLLKSAEAGDKIDLLVERIDAGSDFVGYGRLLIGRYERKDGRTMFAFHHITEEGQEGYFDEKGRPLHSKRFALPVLTGHVTSGFGSRMHPILRRPRPHWGIDFAATKGTPIHAVAAGTVEVAQWNRQLGRMVIIRHANGVESKYAHMSFFGRGIRAGAVVHQGDLVGGVGATGMATGAHLHLETRIDGRLVDPATLLLPQPPELTETELASLRERVLEGWEDLESARFEGPGGSVIGDGNTINLNLPNLAALDARSVERRRPYASLLRAGAGS